MNVLTAADAAPGETNMTKKTAKQAKVKTTNNAEAKTTPKAANVPLAKGKATKKAIAEKDTPAAPANARTARSGSKTEIVLELLKREGGVTAEELMTATGWQTHSVRGFLSGTVGKKMGLEVNSVKNEAGDRRYTLAS
jgi:hypothetical protein